MVTKEEFESILSKYYVIDPPSHLLMLERPAVGFSNGLSFYKGLQPKWRGDIVIITPQGDDETAIHETIHANFGIGELFTNPAAKILVVKHRMIERLPILKNLHLRFRNRKIHYELCGGCMLCQDLEELLIRAPPRAKPRHYILAKS